MPLYEYECTTCNGHLERRQSFHDAPLRECPTCGGLLVRLLQPAGIIFKGSGWYCTDSRPATGSNPEAGAKDKVSAPS